MFISRKEHERIVAEKDREISSLKDGVKLSLVLQRLVEKTEKQEKDWTTFCDATTTLKWGALEESLSDAIPRYVDDYYGGKVIKQEATKVVILDDNGDATYAVTRKAADRGRKYLLVQK